MVYIDSTLLFRGLIIYNYMHALMSLIVQFAVHNLQHAGTTERKELVGLYPYHFIAYVECFSAPDDKDTAINV